MELPPGYGGAISGIRGSEREMPETKMGLVMSVDF